MQNPDTIRNNNLWKIDEEQAGQRLDRYLVTIQENISRTTAQQMVAEGAVLVNGRLSKPCYALRIGDEVQVLQIVARPYTGTAKPQPLALDVTYEDADLLVINKAAGMVVHPAPGHSDDTLVNALVALYPELQQEDGDQRPGIVHRLDRDTSGLLLVADNAHTQAALIEQMKRHEITKR